MSTTQGTKGLRNALVDYLVEKGMITEPRVEAAFRAVPRHLFVPGVTLERAYSDEAIPTKHEEGLAISSSSQPAIMALMLEQLALEPGQRVLEIGAGTGYNAALMAQLVGKAGGVVSVDIDQDIVDDARAHLAAADCKRVHVAWGDGAQGFPPGAPYDRIILTVAAWDIAPAWWEQLKPGGRLVMPLSVRGPQYSIAFRAFPDRLESDSVLCCGFMEMRGELAAEDRIRQLGPEPVLRLRTAEAPPADDDLIYAWLAGPWREHDSAITASMPEIVHGLEPWLAFSEKGLCNLLAAGIALDRDLVPPLFGYGGELRSRFTNGVIGEGAIALLSRPPEVPLPDDLMDSGPFRLYVRQSGPDSGPARRLIEHIRAWDAAGRPGVGALRVRAFRPDAAIPSEPDQAVITRPWTRLVLNWT